MYLTTNSLYPKNYFLKRQKEKFIPLIKLSISLFLLLASDFSTSPNLCQTGFTATNHQDSPGSFKLALNKTRGEHCMEIGGGCGKHVPATTWQLQSMKARVVYSRPMHCTLACEQGLESPFRDPHKCRAQCHRSWYHGATETAMIKFPTNLFLV